MDATDQTSLVRVKEIIATLRRVAATAHDQQMIAMVSTRADELESAIPKFDPDSSAN